MKATKFLGVIFDRRLSFVPHLKYIKKKGLKALSIANTFGLRIKQFLTASNIVVFSDILKTHSYFVLPHWYIRPPKILLDLMHLKKDCTDASIYQQLFKEIRERYRDYIPVYTDGYGNGNYVACATVFSSNTIISMRLPDSAFIFTAEIWAIIKALEVFLNYVASKYIVFTNSLSSLRTLQFMRLEHPLIGMVIRKCIVLRFDNKDIICVGYLAILVLEVTKRQTAAKSALDLPHAKVGVPYTD